MKHPLSCSHSEFLSIYHTELRDITAELLSEVCQNVGAEPLLQPLPELWLITDEHLIHRTANREDGARLDVTVKTFGESEYFFNTRGFNSLVSRPSQLFSVAREKWEGLESKITCVT